MAHPSTGNSIGNYTICEQIGSGGVGSVWKAVDESLGRTVAIKTLRPENAGREGFLERLRSEAQTLARLNHPNIATVFSLVEDDTDLHLVMEYVEGETLAHVLKTRPRMDVPDCFALYHQALEGMQYAHEAGVVHRDLKPQNLMVNGRGLLKVLDFGIARVDGTRRITRTGLLVGTPEYMAPEQVRGGDGTVASDVYALGVLLYEMLVGRPPFTGGAEYDVLRQQVEATPPSPRALGAGCSEQLEGVVLRALEKAPADRFADVRSLREALIEAGAPAPPAWELPARPALPTTDERKPPTVVPGNEELAATQELVIPRETRTLDALPEPTPPRRRVRLSVVAALVVAAAASLNWLDHRPVPSAAEAPGELGLAFEAAPEALPEPANVADEAIAEPAEVASEPQAEPMRPRPASRMVPSHREPTPRQPAPRRWEVRRQ